MGKTRLDKMVDAFAEKMKKRLRKKARDGWTGWDDKMFHEGEITNRIQRQVVRIGWSLKEASIEREIEWRKIDPIDLANYCAFLNLKQEDGE